MRLAAFVALVFTMPVSAVDPSPSCVSVIRRDGAGSGTVVQSSTGRSLVITCRHVCPDAGKVWVVASVDGKQKRLEARWLGVSATHDLALLSVDTALTAATIADANPDIGDTVTHYGRASGPQSGLVSEHKVYADRTVDIQTEMLAVQGDSGAGVFNAKGHLFGVHHGSEIRKDDSENSLACQLSAVLALVEKHTPKRIPTKLGE